MALEATQTYLGAAREHSKKVQWVVEIDLPRCGNTYTQAPCMAPDLGDGQRCSYSFSTCQDPANFTPSTRTLRFCLATVPWTELDARAYPMLEQLVDVPQKIEERKLATFPETIRLPMARDFDPDPLDADRGAGFYNTARSGEFWANLLATTLNWSGKPARLYRGFQGLPYPDFQKVGPTYKLKQIRRRGSRYEIVAESPLAVLNRARTPYSVDESNVLGVGGIGAGATIIPVANGADYPDPADFTRFKIYIRMNDEVCEVTSIVGNDLNVVRGRLGTTATTHPEETKIEHVAFFGTDNGDQAPTGRNVVDVLLDLMHWAGIEASEINEGTFRVVRNQAWPRNDVLRLISKPQKISTLMQPLRESRGILIYMDAQGQWAANVVAPNEDAPLLTDDILVEDSVVIDEDDEERITRVEIWWSPLDPDDAGDEPKDYQFAAIVIDAALESDLNFGESRPEVLTDAWSDPSSPVADVRLIADRLIGRKQYGVRRITFALDVADAIYDVGDAVRIRSRRLTGVLGAPVVREVLITAKSQPTGSRTQYEGLDVAFNAGATGYMRIAPDGVAESYDAASEDDRGYGYWADEDGRVGPTLKVPAYLYW